MKKVFFIMVFCMIATYSFALDISNGLSLEGIQNEFPSSIITENTDGTYTIKINDELSYTGSVNNNNFYIQSRIYQTKTTQAVEVPIEQYRYEVIENENGSYTIQRDWYEITGDISGDVFIPASYTITGQPTDYNDILGFTVETKTITTNYDDHGQEIGSKLQTSYANGDGEWSSGDEYGGASYGNLINALSNNNRFSEYIAAYEDQLSTILPAFSKEGTVLNSTEFDVYGKAVVDSKTGVPLGGVLSSFFFGGDIIVDGIAGSAYLLDFNGNIHVLGTAENNSSLAAIAEATQSGDIEAIYQAMLEANVNFGNTDIPIFALVYGSFEKVYTDAIEGKSKASELDAAQNSSVSNILGAYQAIKDKKRIYTVQEATEALGKNNKNTFSITYR